MKFCYIDESGTGDEPIAVMAGVLVDAYRMKPSKSNWDELLETLSEIVDREVKEFHTYDFYAGNSPWRNLDGTTRKNILSAIFDWYEERKHSTVYSIIDKQKFARTFREHKFAASIGNLWKTLALHTSLAIQKANKSKKNNKGNTVLIFDAHDRDERSFTELLLDPPAWTDTYYSKTKKQKQLDQIIDVPHFVDSSHVGLIQLADCISYFLRRHFEIVERMAPERYSGEGEIVGKWANAALNHSISPSAIYPKRGRCEAAEFFYQLAPDSAVK